MKQKRCAELHIPRFLITILKHIKLPAYEPASHILSHTVGLPLSAVNGLSRLTSYITEQEQQRVAVGLCAVGPGNAHCMSNRRVSLRAALAGIALYTAACRHCCARCYCSAAAAAADACCCYKAIY